MIPKLNIYFPLRRVVKSFKPWIKGFEYNSCEGNVFYVNHARTGLRIALTALNLPQGSKIGVSMYNCLTVFTAIRCAGYEPEFLDINDDLLLDIEDLKKKKNNIAALIVTHFFGIVNDIDAVKNIVPDMPIIEDCAHAYGSKNIDGTDVGTKGVFSVFSIGLGKFPSIGDGGILRVNNASFMQMVTTQVEKLKNYSFHEEVVMIIKSHIKHIAYRPFVYGLLLPIKKKQQDKGALNEMYQHKEAKMPRSVRYLYEISKEDLYNQKQEQLRIHKKIRSKIAYIDGVYLPKYDYNICNGFLFPFLIDDANALNKCEYFKDFEKTSHFAKSIEWAKSIGYINNCPNAEIIAEKNVVLSCCVNIEI